MTCSFSPPAKCSPRRLHRGILPFAAEASKSLLDKLTQQESDYVKNVDKVNLFISHAQAREGAQAMEIYDQFPDSLKKDKNILIMRLAAARSLGPEQEDAAIRAFRSACPHDPALDLLLIDSYFFHKQYAKVRSLDRSAGSARWAATPIWTSSGPVRFWRKATLRAPRNTSAKPSRPRTPWCPPTSTSSSIALREKDFDETSRLLTVIREKFPKKMPDVRRNPLYAQYIKSPQYEAWLKTLKQP